MPKRYVSGQRRSESPHSHGRWEAVGAARQECPVRTAHLQSRKCLPQSLINSQAGLPHSLSAGRPGKLRKRLIRVCSKTRRCPAPRDRTSLLLGCSCDRGATSDRARVWLVRSLRKCQQNKGRWATSSERETASERAQHEDPQAGSWARKSRL